MRVDRMRCFGVFLLPLLLAGCESGRRAAQQPPPVQLPAPPMADISVDPLGGADPSTGGNASYGGSGLPGAGSEPPAMPDPMVGSSGSDGAQADPLAAGGDPLKGPVMPTQHSHWLSVGSGHARLIVKLNGIRYGDTFISGTHDITMRLRPGINTLSVRYQPQTQRAWASVVLTEGESGPTGRNLATFRQTPLPDKGEMQTVNSPPLPEINRMMIFTAK